MLPTVNAELMSLHLAEISKCVAASAHAILVLDGAGWHQAGGRLVVPENITLMPLPPYAPELNPVENIWVSIRFQARPIFGVRPWGWTVFCVKFDRLLGVLVLELVGAQVSKCRM